MSGARFSIGVTDSLHDTYAVEVCKILENRFHLTPKETEAEDGK